MLFLKVSIESTDLKSLGSEFHKMGVTKLKTMVSFCPAYFCITKKHWLADISDLLVTYGCCSSLIPGGIWLWSSLQVITADKGSQCKEDRISATWELLEEPARSLAAKFWNSMLIKTECLIKSNSQISHSWENWRWNGSNIFNYPWNKVVSGTDEELQRFLYLMKWLGNVYYRAKNSYINCHNG